MFTSFLHFSRFYNSHFSLILLAYANFGRDKNQFPPTKYKIYVTSYNILVTIVSFYNYVNYIFSKNMKRCHFIDDNFMSFINLTTLSIYN